MRPVAAAPDFTPIFDWSPPRSRRAPLIGFIAGSALLHGLCFYAFQIIYPPTVALLPPPARLDVITPGTDEGRLLLRWIEAEDPALASTTQRPPDSPAVAPPAIAHVPSYQNRAPALRDLPPLQSDLRIPSFSPPAPVTTPRATPAAAPEKVQSSVYFSIGRESIKPRSIPELRFTTASRETPQAAQFRVAIGELGDVRHVFLERSSDDSGLDEQARRYIALCRFPAIQNRESSPKDESVQPAEKIENSLTWATAIVEWGNDIAAASPTPAGAPRP